MIGFTLALLVGLFLGMALVEMRARQTAPRSTLTVAAAPDARPGEVLRLATTSGPAGTRLVLAVDGTRIYLRDLTKFERWRQDRWRRSFGL